ncbi:hypothetical protein [Nocardioides sp. Soil805]|uniref:hypothetical protein n=1 Tax=Nocardioides sp. Soil805 TaxID=1736416 RepID=UPI000702D3BE|nr:hypothetical protein [Nocardioides sp. Soil805]KRF37406.1 hypothetical protein ASG94_08775 [Nocardioides sp. Soil805]
MEKNDEQRSANLMSRLMAAPKVKPGERAAVAELADRGVFHAPEFVARCVRPGEPPYVVWRTVRSWATQVGDLESKTLAETAMRAHGSDETDPPLDAERLQVVLDLDDPKGWVVAAWRDIYADHGQTLEVDMCLEYLTDQHLCWNCGDLGVTERDDLFWSAACLTNDEEQK